MINRRALKGRARLALSRSYTKCLGACAIVYFLSEGGAGVLQSKLKNVDFNQLLTPSLVLIGVITSLILGLSILIQIFGVAPLRVGMRKFMLQNTKGDTPFDTLFSVFREDYWNTVKVIFFKELYLLLWRILAALPIALLLALYIISERFQMYVTMAQGGNIWAALGVVALTFFVIPVLTIICAIPCIIKKLQYFMVEYIVAEEPTVEWREALKRSKEMMVGNKWDALKLELSFLGWIILGMLCCGIGTYFVYPYIEATYAELYNDLSGDSIVTDYYEVI